MKPADLLDNVLTGLSSHVPKVAAVLLLLVAGWIIALVVRAALRKVLGLARINHRLAETSGAEIDIEKGVSTGGYYLVWLVVLVAVANALQLEIVTKPLQALVTPFFAFLPGAVGAGVLALLAWVLARVVRSVSTQALKATTIDDRLATAADTKVSDNIGTILYWLVFLLFLPPILGALGMGALLRPVEAMLTEILAFLPNLVGAAIIGVVGWFVARILRTIVENLLQAGGADRISQRIGLTGSITPSRLLGMLVQIFVFIPALIAALEALQMAAISGPATAMLESILTAVPDLLVAAAIIGVAWLVTRLVAPMVTSLLAGIGADGLPAKIGLGDVLGEGTVSALAGRLVQVAILLFAAVEAANQLGFGQLSDLVAIFIAFGAQVLLGGVILVVGLFLANLATGAIERLGGEHGAFLAAVARVAILGLVLAMGLDAMGVADTTVNLAFGLTLGAVAVAVALSFGLGGREPAGRLMAHWLDRFSR